MRLQVAGLLGACFISACATTPSEPSPTDIQQVSTDLTAAIGDGKLTPQQFASYGRLAVDRRCKAFFDAVAEGDHRAAAVSDGFRGATNTALAYMAATSRSAESIGEAAVILAGLDSQLMNYRQYEFLRQVGGPAENLVLEAQSEFRLANPPEASADAAAAGQWVHDYADLCSISRILSFVNQAVQQSTAVYEGADAQFIGPAARQVVIAAVRSSADIAGLTDAEWAQLWLILNEGPQAPALVSELAGKFPALRNVLFEPNANALAEPGRVVKAQLDMLRSSSRAFAQATTSLQESRRALQAQADQNARDKAAADARKTERSLTAEQLRGVVAEPVGLPAQSRGGGTIVIRSRP